MTGLQFGVRWVSAVDEFIAQGYDKSGADSMVARCGDPEAWSPHAAEVVCRDVGDWRPAGVEDEPKNAPKETM